MLVTLVRHTPDPEQAVALAARLCYSPITIGDLQERMAGGDIRGFLEKILSLGHHSVLEHASFTFGIEGISRVTTHQLVRHRIASFSQQSQRYVSHKEKFDVIVPPSIAADNELSERFSSLIGDIHRLYGEMVEQGVPAEDARYILPNAAETKILVTMNARELFHFFRLRCCERAQWEIRAMAVEMLKLVRDVAPVIFENAGPSCLAGPCPEGALTCGKASQVRAFFENLR
ncbi:MAG: FAD-dependent thymidylate synthase [Geobacteraceae bacterium]|nr:FAD-dependent thymidylate synthase [Geobacteraceae bacterium]